MTTNQTIGGVPRELLADLADYGESGKAPEPWMVDKLRALLDAPARTPLLGGGALEEQPEWAQIQILKNTVSDLQGDIEKLQADLAAQPQGEPVVLLSKGFTTLETGDGKYRIITQYKNRDDAWSDYTALCKAEQPAPVAVVLPERSYASDEDQQSMTDYEIGLGHGACEMWDKIKALNPSL